jgi:hypothetical protein
MSLTGTWEGHYFQNWVEGGPAEMNETSDFAFGIRVEIVDNDGQLNGRMKDVRTTWSMKMKDALRVAKVSWYQKALLKLFYPVTNDATIGNELPANSSIVGNHNGQSVSFTKSYEGASRHLINTAGHERIVLNEPKPVFYIGTLSEDGNLIEGKFVIGDANETRLEAQGLFRLRRSN